MKTTFLKLTTVLFFTLSACGDSVKSKVSLEHTKLVTEHNDLEAEHAKMETEFLNLDAKYKQKVKTPDSTYISFVNAHKELLQEHTGILSNLKGLFEGLKDTEGKSDAVLETELKRVIAEDARIEKVHKEMKEKHDKFEKEHLEMLNKIK